jgi:hypothetical protein
LSLAQLAHELAERGTPLSPPTVTGGLDDHAFATRKIAKTVPGGSAPDRTPQFDPIATLREQYRAAGNPLFSLDTKKKEHLGGRYRDGRGYCQAAFRACDPDFPSWATGVVSPHGIGDPVRNHGHLNLGLSHDPSEFACESFRWFWYRSGRWRYPAATSILWLWEAGGSNSSRQYLFKPDLQRLVDAMGVESRVAHDPAYWAQFNPIERRFFPHVTRACQGVLFDTLETVVHLMRKTSTQTGLTVSVQVMNKLYETGRKVAHDFKAHMKIVFDRVLPKWNYRAVPQL